MIYKIMKTYLNQMFSICKHLVEAVKKAWPEKQRSGVDDIAKALLFHDRNDDLAEKREIPSKGCPG